MFRYRSTRARLLSSAIGMAVLCVGAAVGRGAEPEPSAGLSQRSLALPPSMTMPARQCLRCDGPVAIPPCFDTHRGFLYYGTYPWDDDPYNGFDDCPGGECGTFGAMLSLRWIAKHQDAGHRHLRHRRRGHHHHSGHCSQCGRAPVAVEASRDAAERHVGGAH